MTYTNTEPEGLYPEYKSDITDALARIMRSGESFRFSAESGMGKSKYLRYITSSQTIYNKYFSKDKIKLVYLDLNAAYRRTADDLIRCFAKSIGVEGTTLDAEEITSEITKLLDEYEKIYFILDQSELLSDFPDEAIHLLRSWRDTFKYRMSYLLSFEKDSNIDEIKLRYLLNVAHVEIVFRPLNEEETLAVIEQERKRVGIDISDEDRAKIAKMANGKPRIIKRFIGDLFLGKGIKINDKSFPEPIAVVDLITNSEFEDVQKVLTKNEFLLFSKLHALKGQGILNRDDIALIISPESNGEGVSNEAIDQLVSRTRKSMKKAGVDFPIKTKRGVGYFI